MDTWSRNVLRGLGVGFGGYAVLYPLTLWLGPKVSPACARLEKKEQLVWASYIPSTVNASVITVAILRHVMNRSVSAAAADSAFLSHRRCQRRSD